MPKDRMTHCHVFTASSAVGYQPDAARGDQHTSQTQGPRSTCPVGSNLQQASVVRRSKWLRTKHPPTTHRKGFSSVLLCLKLNTRKLCVIPLHVLRTRVPFSDTLRRSTQLLSNACELIRNSAMVLVCCLDSWSSVVRGTPLPLMEMKIVRFWLVGLI